jgi:hypothetical protein
MLKKLLGLMFACVVVFSLASAVFAQNAPAKAKEVRWEGRVIRSSKADSNLVVRKQGSTNDERTVQYDSSTHWVSQYHGDNKANDIDASQVKDGDYVICTGTWDKSNVLHATTISKRLSHSPE